jgi:malate/lactate dehydrogenase
MCEQLGKEPDPAKMPPDVDDFPPIVVSALYVYNCLGDRVYPDIGFVGKDYTSLPLYIKTESIENIDLFLEILLDLESRAINHSQKELKREREKLKRKNSGRHNNG